MEQIHKYNTEILAAVGFIVSFIGYLWHLDRRVYHLEILWSADHEDG